MTQAQIGVYRQVFKYYAYLLVVWGLFRFLFKFPELIEELWFKPVIWLLPLLLIVVQQRKRLNFFKGPMLPTLLWGTGVGAAFWLILALIQLSRSGFAGLVIDWQDPAWLDFAGISLVTAITEELTFSGFIYQKFSGIMGKKFWTPLLLTSGLFALLHIPIGLFLYQYGFYQMFFFLLLVLTVQLGNLYVMSQTRNVLGPILSHWFWGLGAFLLL
jgi:membrane protease YdiL (CAAX protease family)